MNMMLYFYKHESVVIILLLYSNDCPIFVSIEAPVPSVIFVLPC